MSYTDLLASAQLWLTRVKQWSQKQSVVSPETLMQQQQDVVELAEFIEGVYGTIEEQAVNNSVISVLLSCLMDIMEQLLNISGIHSDWRCITAVIRCYISYTDVPSDCGSNSPVFFSRLTTLLTSDNCKFPTDVSETVSFTGHTKADFNLAFISEYLRSLTERLSRRSSLSINVNKYPLSPCNVCQPPRLVIICCLCLRLGRRLNVADMITTAISHLHNFHSGDRHVEQLFTWIENVLKFRYTRGCVLYLPYESHVIVWSHGLSTLESDVLDLVSWVKQTPVTSVHKLLDCADHLVCACAAHPGCFTAAFVVLRHIYTCSAGHPATGWIISNLSRAIAVKVSSPTSFLSLLQFGSRCSCLVRHLFTPPAGLNRETCLHHLMDIHAALEGASNEGAYSGDIRWLLVQFADWRPVALFLCLFGDRNQTSRLVYLLGWYYGVNTASAEIKQLNVVVSSLAALIRKSSLSSSDVSFVVSGADDLLPSNSVSQRTSPAQLLARHLLIVFCVQSVGGATVLLHVLSMVSRDSAFRPTLLNHCTDVLDLFNNSPVKWANGTIHRPTEISRTLTGLVAESVNYDSKVASQSSSVRPIDAFIHNSASSIVKRFLLSLTDA